MSSDNGIIHLLPDNVASRIAAGEVVQRPASVVKELVENSIDAGATRISVILKDSGRTLIQVVDNGSGMSATDAVNAFKRHATSKISSDEDLYKLSTMGFRGEALYSIAAVAEVEVKTRREEDETGSRVVISDGELLEQELVVCNKGCNISVRNLFFNVPARRKFLKSNETELRNIISCFEQIATVYNNISFSLSNNGNSIYDLAEESRLHRILSLFGKKLGTQMLPLEADTSLVRISGYTGSLEVAQKRGGGQFFFVNGRYIQHPYFNKAVSMAYEKLLPADMRPSYFIFFDVDPSTIDVNIHPQKTEVKFENEQAIFPIITACVREALNKANIMPGIDFEGADSSILPSFGSQHAYTPPPTIEIDPNYNPFAGFEPNYVSKKPAEGWQTLYPNLDHNEAEERGKANSLFIVGGKYAIRNSFEGLEATDLYRACYQTVYERYCRNAQGQAIASTNPLFPQLLEFTPKEELTFKNLRPALEAYGFGFSDFGKHAYQISTVPADAADIDAAAVIKEMLAAEVESIAEVRENHRIAEALARRTAAASIPSHAAAAEELLAALRNCQSPDRTSYGKPIKIKIGTSELKQLFNK